MRFLLSRVPPKELRQRVTRTKSAIFSSGEGPMVDAVGDEGCQEFQLLLQHAPQVLLIKAPSMEAALGLLRSERPPLDRPSLMALGHLHTLTLTHSVESTCMQPTHRSCETLRQRHHFIDNYGCSERIPRFRCIDQQDTLTK